MSFGWSAGDIVASLQLLNKAISALKEIGGASSEYQHVINFLGLLTVTLQHLKALQYAPLDPDLSKNLEQHSTAVQGPLKSFLERIYTRFDKDLGADKTRPKILTAGPKLRWAFSMSKEVKDLERKIGGHIGAIGLVMSQQVIQNTLQMPSEIQARIAHTIDAVVDRRMNQSTLNIQKEVMALAVAEKASSKRLEEMIQNVSQHNATEIQNQSQQFFLDLEQKFNILSLNHQACKKRLSPIEHLSQTILDTVKFQSTESRLEMKDIQEKVSNLSSRQSLSADMSHKTMTAVHRYTSSSQHQTLGLHRKLDHITWLMGTVKGSMDDLSSAQRHGSLNASKSDMRVAIDMLQRSICLLVSALHVFIRELIYLLAPYIVAIYRTSIQPLLLYGDHFLFEDAIGRRKWLPCLQFQHWENFYGLLVDSFQGTSGLNRVLNGQFVVLNSYNEVPIHKIMWRSGIQPKARIHMAIIVESIAAGKDKCATPSCPGQIDFGKNEITGQCRVCGKHISILKDVLEDDKEFTPETSFSFDFCSKVKIPVFTSTFDSSSAKLTKRSKSSTTTFGSGAGKTTRNPLAGTDKEIAMFKRVVWQNIDEQTPEPVEIIKKETGSLRQQPRRAREVKSRHKSTPRTWKSEGSQAPKFAPIPSFVTAASTPAATHPPVTPFAAFAAAPPRTMSSQRFIPLGRKHTQNLSLLEQLTLHRQTMKLRFRNSQVPPHSS